MKLLLTMTLLVALTAAALAAFQGASRLTSVEPDTAKTGDTATAKGEMLDKTSIGKLYLTDGKHDIETSISGQSASEIKFTVPKCSPGRYRLMLLTANKASLIEQPIVLTVE